MAIGVIAEFNPFHNGHRYLLKKARENTKDGVIVIMSGAFVQRGGIAVTDKLSRAQTAVLNGADLVLELPVTISHNTAQKFALGAISLLNATGIVDSIAFGSECGDCNALIDAADILLNEPVDVSNNIKKHMANGMSYPAARENAYSGYFDTSVLSSPNDILALEYIRAAKEIGASITPIAVKRIGTEHDSADTTETVASASEIRRRIYSGATADDFMPNHSFTIYNPSHLDTAVISHFRLTNPSSLSEINEVGEGLENRFIKAAQSVSSVADLCMAVKSKRYTLSRIRRIAYSALLGITKEIAAIPPSYLRVLAMNDNGKNMLRRIKKASSLPLVIKPADYQGDEIFNINCRAEDIFALCSDDETKRNGGNDLRMTPFIC